MRSISSLISWLSSAINRDLIIPLALPNSTVRTNHTEPLLGCDCLALLVNQHIRTHVFPAQTNTIQRRVSGLSIQHELQEWVGFAGDIFEPIPVVRVFVGCAEGGDVIATIGRDNRVGEGYIGGLRRDGWRCWGSIMTRSGALCLLF